jgi:hypothetical protein
MPLAPMVYRTREGGRRIHDHNTKSRSQRKKATTHVHSQLRRCRHQTHLVSRSRRKGSPLEIFGATACLLFRTPTAVAEVEPTGASANKKEEESQHSASYNSFRYPSQKKLTSCVNIPARDRPFHHIGCISAIPLSWKAPVFPPQRRLRRTRDPGGRPACIWCTPLCRR